MAEKLDWSRSVRAAHAAINLRARPRRPPDSVLIKQSVFGVAECRTAKYLSLLEALKRHSFEYNKYVLFVD